MKTLIRLALALVAIVALAGIAQAASSVATFGVLTATHYSDGSTVIKITSGAHVPFYAHLTSAQTTTLRTTMCGGCTISTASADTGTAPSDDNGTPYLSGWTALGNNH